MKRAIIAVIAVISVVIVAISVVGLMRPVRLARFLPTHSSPAPNNSATMVAAQGQWSTTSRTTAAQIVNVPTTTNPAMASRHPASSDTSQAQKYIIPKGSTAIGFTREAYSDPWQKTTQQPPPEFQDLYQKNYFCITGNSEGAKTFETIGTSNSIHQAGY